MIAKLTLLTLLCTCAISAPEDNGSVAPVTWTTNPALGLTNKMRTYGNGYHLTKEEETALDKLRPLVEGAGLLPFQRRDNFLVKFLRARKNDVKAAADMYKAAMNWRKTYLHKIMKKDFSRLEKHFPFIQAGLDKNHAPVFYVRSGTYDFRKAVLAGTYKQLEELFDRDIELGLRASVAEFETTGHNAGLSCTIVYDIRGFNMQQQGCTKCISIFSHMFKTFKEYYPYMITKTLFINTPDTFKVVLSTIRPIMSDDMSKMMEVYDADKQKWEAGLLKYIDKNQLLKRYGGNREEKPDTVRKFGR